MARLLRLDTRSVLGPRLAQVHPYRACKTRMYLNFSTCVSSEPSLPPSRGVNARGEGRGEEEGEGRRSRRRGRRGRRRRREKEKPRSRPQGIRRAVPWPEAARHLGQPYIGEYSRIEKVPLYLKPFSLLLDQQPFENKPRIRSFSSFLGVGSNLIDNFLQESRGLRSFIFSSSFFLSSRVEIIRTRTRW